MRKLDRNSIKVINEIIKKTGNSTDIIIKTLKYANTNIHLIFFETLCNTITINKYILEYFEKEDKNFTQTNNIYSLLKTKLPLHKINKIDNYDNLFLALLSGFTIILIEDYDEALAIETRAKLDSGINEATAETLIKGPKDAFTENYQTNIGLIRKRIRTEKLWLEELIVGTKSNTKVGFMYVKDIVDIKLVKTVIDKVKKIEIDAIPDSNYIIELISENKNNFFANFLSTERPDLVSKSLLEGKIAIVVENTQYVIIIPTVFLDFFQTTEDYYQKPVNISYTRIIRWIAF